MVVWLKKKNGQTHNKSYMQPRGGPADQGSQRNGRSLEITQRKTFKLFLCLSIVFILSFLNGIAPAATSVNGTLRQVGNQQVLNVWGSNYEMGYAHGYLMADKIRDLVDHYMIGLLAGGSVATYNALLAQDGSTYGFQWQQQYLDEINGMAAGMVASGKNLYVSSLGRNIDARDIRAFNLQEEFFFGCSSFGVWGKATASSETILARNFDFYLDVREISLTTRSCLPMSRRARPNLSLSHGRVWLEYSPASMKKGVSVIANTGNADNPYGGPFHPVVEVFRSILENTTLSNYLTQPLSIDDSFYELTSEILQIGIPYKVPVILCTISSKPPTRT